MLGKVWKKVLFIILIVACVFNVMFKLVKRTSLKDEIESTIKYVKSDKVVENVVEDENDTNAKSMIQEGLEDPLADKLLEHNGEQPKMVIELN